MLIGYARVSTTDQNPDLQIDALLRAGVDQRHIFEDRMSGLRADRPKLNEALAYRKRGKNRGTLKRLTLQRDSRRVVCSLIGCKKYRYRQVTGPKTKARIGLKPNLI